MELIYYISLELDDLPKATVITKEVLQGIISRAQTTMEEYERQIDDFPQGSDFD